MDTGATAYPVGIVTCGSVWACPVCSAKIRARRSVEVELAALRWAARGGELVMVTSTIRHHRRHQLSDTRSALTESWRGLQRTRRWAALRSGELVHLINSTEVTHGPNGFHPHHHTLLFLAPGTDSAAVAGELVGWLPRSYRSIVERRCPEMAPTLRHGVVVQALDADAAAYVSKIADEHTRADLKGDAGNPFALLDAFADGEASSIAAWCEYVAAMKGARAIVMSRGLRADLLPDVEELSDEDVAAIEVDGQVLELVPPATWLRWCRLRNEHGVIEALARLEEHERRLLVGGTEVTR